MHSPIHNGEIVRTYAGRGEITFPLGGRIQSHFQLSEYSGGQRLLACTGQFTQESYAQWERLVHRYRIDSHLPLEKARQSGLAARYTGRTAENQQLIIQQMVLIDAQAQGVAVLNKKLTLQMKFVCYDASISL